MTLGEQIKQAREVKNFSQEELASKLDVSRQAISKWENNTSIPKGINREMLNQVLDLSLGIEEDINDRLTGKYKTLMIVGWGLAILFAITTVILSAILYQVKTDTVRYLPQETVIKEISGDQGTTGTDSDSETVHIYYDNGMATEEEVNTSDYLPNEK